MGLSRDAGTKVTGDLKVGAKVTVEYRMVATSIEVRGGEAKAPAGKPTTNAKPSTTAKAPAKTPNTPK